LEQIFKSAQWIVGAKAPGNTMAELARDDQELLRQLSKGNEPAFTALYERYQGPIYRFALHMSGNNATAEEATQEVFMQLINNPRGYDAGKGTVAGYLFGIARNITRRAVQDSRCELVLEEEDLALDEFAMAGELDVLGELTNGELLAALRSAILCLPQQYREAVVLCDLEEFSYQQAGELLGCSPGTVASRLHRGHAILKKKLSCQKKLSRCVK
jgi:RNA polymerase sigma-70 factor (ECF subfamily)